jgi:hypothetical protein
MKRKITQLFLSICLVVIGVVQAETALAESFRIYLEYNQNTDRLDLRTSLGRGGFEVVDTANPFPIYPDGSRYSVSLYEDQTEIIKYPYQPENSGPFLLDVPYISVVNRIVIKKEDIEIIEIDTSSSVKCNRNGICEASLGESLINCVPDCDGDNVVYDQEGERLTAQNPLVRDDSQRLLYQTPVPESTTGEEDVPDSNDLFSWRLVLGGVFVIGGISFGIYRLVKRFV